MKNKRKRKAIRRTGLDTAELRWKAGREPMEATVTGRPMNQRLLETSLGIVRVTDSAPFPRAPRIPVWVEQGSGKLYCKGKPQRLDRY